MKKNPRATAQPSTYTRHQPAIPDVLMATAPSKQRGKSTTANANIKAWRGRWRSSWQCVHATKDAKTRQVAPARPETTTEPPAAKTIIAEVTMTTKRRQEIELCPMRMNQKQQQRRTDWNHGSRTARDWTENKQFKECSVQNFNQNWMEMIHPCAKLLRHPCATTIGACVRSSFQTELARPCGKMNSWDLVHFCRKNT